MAVRVWFVSGPQDGIEISIAEGVNEVVVEDLRMYPNYQSNEVVKPRRGYYVRIGNLLVWEGWGKS